MSAHGNIPFCINLSSILSIMTSESNFVLDLTKSPKEFDTINRRYFNIKLLCLEAIQFWRFTWYTKQQE